MDSWMLERGNILGVNVSAVNSVQGRDFIANCIDSRQQEYICVVPAHTVMDCRADPALRRIVNASGLSTPDGMSIVWLLKLHGHSGVERVYGPDLMLETCLFGLSRKWRHFFYGGEEGVANTLAARLVDRFPGLQVVGTYCPPFRPLTEEEDQKIIRMINDSHAHIVWVGLSSPKQKILDGRASGQN